VPGIGESGKRTTLAGGMNVAPSTTMRRLLFALLPLLSVSPTTACALATTCDTSYKWATIGVTREMAVPFKDVGNLTVEACYGLDANSRCASARVVAGALQATSTGIVGELKGTITELPNGRSRIEATFGVGEGSNPVVFQVKDQNGKVVVSALGNIQWSDDACHPKALNTTL
jgi:hypothetical protein